MGYSFDGTTRICTLTAGTTELEMHDCYSRWKEWFKGTDDGKSYPMFATVGGEDVDESVGTKVPLFAFLQGGWRIKPQEADHTLAVTGGILLVLGGGDPFIDTTGDFQVRINYQQPVQVLKLETGTSGLTPEESDILDSIDSRLPAALVGGAMDSTLSVSEREAVADAILDRVGGIETNRTLRQGLRLMLAVLINASENWAAGHPKFKDTAGSKTRVEADVDEYGNRSNVQTDAS